MTSSRQDRQVVVASDHLGLVIDALGGDRNTETEVNPRLGLTLVTLADLGAAPAAAAPRRPGAPTVDDVLRTIRRSFEKAHRGWSPTMGKNRTLTGVQFKPISNGGGVDRPHPVDPPVAGPSADGGGRRVRVGLFDTRLAPHARLTGRYLTAPDALAAPLGDDQVRLWWEGHATFIAGVVARQAPTAALDVRTALRPGTDPDDGGPTADESWTMPVWSFAARLADYQDAGVEVINLSVGVATDDGKPPLVLERAIAQLTPSVVVVAAAGNHGLRTLTSRQRAAAGLPPRGAALFPAALDNVLAVGALDGQDVADFNPCGAGGTGVAPWIDVFAPGVDTVSTYLGDGHPEKVFVPLHGGGHEIDAFGGWAVWSGTSFAAGEVTGAVAALLARGRSAAEAVDEIRHVYRKP